MKKIIIGLTLLASFSTLSNDLISFSNDLEVAELSKDMRNRGFNLSELSTEEGEFKAIYRKNSYDALGGIKMTTQETFIYEFDGDKFQEKSSEVINY